LSETLQSSQKTVSGLESGDETSYVDDYAGVGEEKQVDGYRCNNWVNEEDPSEKVYLDPR